MTVHVYYRGLGKKLHQIDVQDIDPFDAIKLVQAHLKDEGEVFHKPVLAVIKGGQHG